MVDNSQMLKDSFKGKRWGQRFFRNIKQIIVVERKFSVEKLLR